MKKIAVILSAFTLFFAACGDNSADSENKDEGSEQVKDPVLNSGPETEQERATDAVSDSSVRSDTNAQSLPH